jgi:flagellar motility protein MotE (MotC chaperone)
MRLLRLQDVEIGVNDRVFRHARLQALIVWLAGFSATAALFFHAYTRKWPPGYIFGSFLLLFVLLTLRMVTARFHPSNWLVRMNEAGIYVQYRSYLNYQLPPDDPSVVFVSLGEIASARLVKERVEPPDPAKPGGTQTQYLRYVELELSGETAPLAKALQDERGEQAPLEKRWYGTSSTLYRDYPLTMIAPTFLRIRWNVVPGARKFLDALRPYTVIADPVSLTRDFTRLKSLSREDQQQQLRELAARGQTITAMYAARELYGCSLGEAKEMVDSLRQNKVPE